MEYKKVITTSSNGEFIGHIELNGEMVDGTNRTSASKIGISSLLGTVIKGLPSIDVSSTTEEILPSAPETVDNIDIVIEPEENQETISVDESFIEEDNTNSEPSVMMEEEPINADAIVIGIDLADELDVGVVTTFVDGGRVDTIQDRKIFSGDKFDVKKNHDNYVKNLKNKVSDIIEISGVRVHIIPNLWASSLKFKHKEVGYSLEILSPNEIMVSRVLDINLGVDYFENHIPKLVAWMNDDLKLEKTGKTIHNHNNASSMVIWDFNTYNILATVNASKY